MFGTIGESTYIVRGTDRWAGCSRCSQVRALPGGRSSNSVFLPATSSSTAGANDGYSSPSQPHYCYKCIEQKRRTNITCKAVSVNGQFLNDTVPICTVAAVRKTESLAYHALLVSAAWFFFNLLDNAMPPARMLPINPEKAAKPCCCSRHMDQTPELPPCQRNAVIELRKLCRHYWVRCSLTPLW